MCAETTRRRNADPDPPRSGSDDKALLQQALRNLSESSVQRRFLAPKPRFTAPSCATSPRSTAATTWRSSPIAHRAGPAPDRGGPLVRDPEHPDSAEAAIVVADEWQGRGVGSLLAGEFGRRASSA